MEEIIQLEDFKDISLYLLKPNYLPQDVIKPETPPPSYHSPLASFHDREDFLITYGNIFGNIPKWSNSYGISEEEAQKLIPKTPFCLFFVRFDASVSEIQGSSQGSESSCDSQPKQKERWMVITHGCGFQRLETAKLERCFGYNAVLNFIDTDNITSLNAKAAGVKARTFQANVPRGGTFDDHRKFLTDSVRRIAGKVKRIDGNAELGSKAAGSNMLQVKFKEPKNWKELPHLCKRYYAKYLEKADPLTRNSQPIGDKKLIQNLNKKLIEALKQRFNGNDDVSDDTVLLDFPWTKDIIDFGEIKFLNLNNNDSIYEFPDLNNYYEEIKKCENAKTIFEKKPMNNNEIMKLLEQHRVQLSDDSKEEVELMSWTVYECLCFDVKENENHYALRDGIWWNIKLNFLKKVQAKFDSAVRDSSLEPFNKALIIEWCKLNSVVIEKSIEEKHYNEYAAKIGKHLNLDRECIPFGPKIVGKKNHNTFEVCDILTKNGELIHVKFRGGFHLMGHLLNQGDVSAQLLKNDETILPKIIERLEKIDGGKEYIPVISQKPEKLTVVFAVIARLKNKHLTLSPLIKFYEISRKIENLGYKVQFDWVDYQTSSQPVIFPSDGSTSTITHTASSSSNLPDNMIKSTDSGISLDTLSAETEIEISSSCETIDENFKSNSQSSLKRKISDNVLLNEEQAELYDVKKVKAE